MSEKAPQIRIVTVKEFDKAVQHELRKRFTEQALEKVNGEEKEMSDDSKSKANIS